MSFVFHKEWEKMICVLPDDIRLVVLDAIVQYGTNGTVTIPDGIAGGIFMAVKNDIDNDNHRRESIRRKRSEAGKKHKGNQYSNKMEQMEQVFHSKRDKCSTPPVNKGASEVLKNGTCVPSDKRKEETPHIPPNKETPPLPPKEINPLLSPKEEKRHPSSSPKKTKKIVLSPNAPRGYEQYSFSFVNYDFLPILFEWLEYKSSRGQKYKNEKSIGILYKKLYELSGGVPIRASEIIEQSIANNWSGIFELRERNRSDTRLLNNNVTGKYKDTSW